MSGEASSRNALREELAKSNASLALVMFSLGVFDITLDATVADRFARKFPKGAVVMAREKASGVRQFALVDVEVAKEMMRDASGDRPPGDEGINGSGPHGILRPYPPL